MIEIPSVGDRRFESFLVRTLHGAYVLSPPEPCVVTYVNRMHRWYEVRFERMGFCCGFKFDDLDADSGAD